MKLRVDIHRCNGCGRAIVIEEDESVNVCPYTDCLSDDLEYSHSGHIVNDID